MGEEIRELLEFQHGHVLRQNKRGSALRGVISVIASNPQEEDENLVLRSSSLSLYRDNFQCGS